MFFLNVNYTLNLYVYLLNLFYQLLSSYFAIVKLLFIVYLVCECDCIIVYIQVNFIQANMAPCDDVGMTTMSRVTVVAVFVVVLMFIYVCNNVQEKLEQCQQSHCSCQGTWQATRSHTVPTGGTYGCLWHPWGPTWDSDGPSWGAHKVPGSKLGCIERYQRDWGRGSIRIQGGGECGRRSFWRIWPSRQYRLKCTNFGVTVLNQFLLSLSPAFSIPRYIQVFQFP